MATESLTKSGKSTDSLPSLGKIYRIFSLFRHTLGLAPIALIAPASHEKNVLGACLSHMPAQQKTDLEIIQVRCFN